MRMCPLARRCSPAGVRCVSRAALQLLRMIEAVNRAFVLHGLPEFYDVRASAALSPAQRINSHSCSYLPTLLARPPRHLRTLS